MKIFTVLAVVFYSLACGAESDWPQWRYGANRGAATAHELPENMTLLWELDAGKPSPAFEHQMRVCADITYAPVAAGGLLFVPSSRTDSLTAYELKTGEEKWSFTTGGPVRFAPVAANGKVWFGSDDGFFYCLNASDGKLLWKLRGAPQELPDSRLLANGRMVSRWAVRGGPVLNDGIIYFGAGLWPEEGCYVVAVNAASGKMLWRKDEVSCIRNGMADHGKPFDIGLPPQGYMAVVDNRLLVTSGRSMAAFLDLKTGKMEPYTTMYAKFNPPRGAWYASGMGKYWFQGGNILGTDASGLGDLPPDKIPLAEFCKRFGFTEAELLPPEKKNKKERERVPEHKMTRYQITEEGGEQLVNFAFSDPESAGLSIPRKLEPNEVYFIENRPLYRADPVHLAQPHDETGVFSEPVWTEDTLYWSEFGNPYAQMVHRGLTPVRQPQYDWIVARDLKNPRWTIEKKNFFREREFPVKWKLKAPYKVQLKAGNRLYGGTTNEVAAIQLPMAGTKASIAWTAKVDGVPVNMLAANGCLTVVTDLGKIYTFGTGSGAAKMYPQKIPPTVVSEWDEVVTEASKGRNTPGYAMVLGWNSGELAQAFAAKKDWHVVVIEPDEKTAAQAVEVLFADGLYGEQVQVIAADPAAIDIAPYWADAVVSEDLSIFGQEKTSVLKLTMNMLRPHSGTALLPLDDATHKMLGDKQMAKLGFSVGKSGKWSRLQRGALPGAAEWTHEAGNAACTYASTDQLVRAPLRLMWLSGEADLLGIPEYEYQHSRGAFPLYWKGSIYYLAAHNLHATDMYTGRYLWKYELPQTDKTEAMTWVHRPFARPDDDNYLIMDDRIYVVSDAVCQVIDAATGKKIGTIEIPAEVEMKGGAAWKEFRAENGKLYAVFENTLVCMDAVSGKLIWQRVGQMKDVTFAVHGDKVFSINYDAPPQFGGTTEPSKARVRGLAADTGKELWSVGLTVPVLKEYSIAGVQGGAVDWVAPLKPIAAYNQKHNVLVAIINRAHWTAFDATSGKELWQKKIQWSVANMHRLEAPILLEDYIIPHQQDYAEEGSGFDIRTGAGVDLGNIVPSKRGCGRIVGNEHLLTYRDAASAIYDLDTKKLLRNNAIRSGCTNGMIPAGGILNAPNFANGCVCNYPVFASYALWHPGMQKSAIPDFYEKDSTPGGVK